MRAVFGPVPSRRLGRSLGVDPLVSKHCDWSCIYCQLGRTRQRSTARLAHRPVDEVLREFDEALRAAGPGAIDWVTIVGSGEPTLALGLGDLIAGIRARTKLPIALITNGSLLGWPDLRDEIAPVDAVLPSLDAGSEELFQQINRPASGLSLEDHVEGLRALTRTCRGRVWLEVMLLHSLNTSDAALKDLATQIRRIGPDAIHLVVPTRPAAEPWVRAASAEEIERAERALAGAAQILPPKAVPELGHPGIGDPLCRAVELVTRHPLRDDEMRRMLAAWSRRNVDRVLERLRADPRVQTLVRGDQLYWVPSRGDYVAERNEP